MEKGENLERKKKKRKERRTRKGRKKEETKKGRGRKEKKKVNGGKEGGGSGEKQKGNKKRKKKNEGKKQRGAKKKTGGRRRREGEQNVKCGGRRGDGDAEERNRTEAILALAEMGRSLDSLPKDLAAAIGAGRILGAIVSRYFELEKSGVFRWLLQFGGFKERLLADDLFLTKVVIECGVGIFTKTAAEWERRRENFSKELDFVFADVYL